MEKGVRTEGSVEERGASCSTGKFNVNLTPDFEYENNPRSVSSALSDND
jgi:hypothetical protein